MIGRGGMRTQQISDTGEFSTKWLFLSGGSRRDVGGGKDMAEFRSRGLAGWRC